MRTDARELADGSRLDGRVVVVGAGAAGMVVALELARAGVDVLVVESGRDEFDPELQALAEAAEVNDRHSTLDLATRVQVGGTTNIWGGRCVPYDPVDFDRRPIAGDVAWPVSYDEVRPFFQRACDWFLCGKAVFDAQQVPGLAGRTLVPGLPDGDVRTSDLERWSLPTNFARYADELASLPNARLVTGLTVTRIEEDGAGRVRHLVARSLDGRTIELHGERYVLAGGAFGTTRLLLASDVGGGSGHLGRWFMVHVDGKIASVKFTTPPRETIYEHERDEDGVYVRRRFTFSRELQHEQGLPNIAIWLVNPELGNASHGSGVLSFAYLALASPLGRFFIADAIREAHTKTTTPVSWRAHLRNVLLDLPKTVRFAFSFGFKRYVKRGRKAPGFFTYSAANEYPIQYHGEHLPHPDSRVTLSDEVDALGMPRLKIDLRFGDDEPEHVVRAHRALDEHLRRHGVGRLEFKEGDLVESVREQLHGGAHQAGLTRMSERPEDGVVDPQLAVHGFDDLFVASGSVLPTSGQANTTFMIVVFALRLADHLRAQLR